MTRENIHATTTFYILDVVCYQLRIRSKILPLQDFWTRVPGSGRKGRGRARKNKRRVAEEAEEDNDVEEEDVGDDDE